MVLINWLYIAITSFLAGFAVLSLYCLIFKAKIHTVKPCIWAGLAFNTVFAEVWSLFGGVGLAANIVLSLACVAVFIVKRKDICELLENSREKVAEVKAMPIVYAAIIILMAYGTSRGYIHFDTDLYHAQSIRWIEEYGVVKGLACLQIRFGYNSAAFALTALYSFRDILGQSLHTTAGFFALLGAFHVSDVYKVFTEKKVRYSDFIRIGLLFYLGLIFKEMTSPASDYYAQVLIFSVLIMWLEALEEEKSKEEKSAYPFAMLSILLVYAATVKFSIALLVLLVIKPAVRMIKERQVKQIVASILGGIAVLIPFFIRNYLISGWLIYPSTIIDIFNPDWKIPKGMAQYDAMEIGVYGKGINDVTKMNMPFGEWFPSWFMGMSLIEKGWVCLTGLAIIGGAVYFVWKLCRKKADYDRLLVWAVVTAGCLFWFFSAPLVRYGYGYLTCMPLLFDGMLCFDLTEKTGDRKSLFIAYVLVFALIGIYRVKTVGYDIVTTAKEPYYISQKDYNEWPAEEYNLGGQTIYIPTEDGMIGYSHFPASLLLNEVELRGSEIKDGFRFSD